MSLIRQQKKTKAPLRPNLQTNKYEEKRDEGKATCDFSFTAAYSLQEYFSIPKSTFIPPLCFYGDMAEEEKKVVNQEQKPHR